MDHRTTNHEEWASRVPSGSLHIYESRPSQRESPSEQRAEGLHGQRAAVVRSRGAEGVNRRMDIFIIMGAAVGRSGEPSDAMQRRVGGAVVLAESSVDSRF